MMILRTNGTFQMRSASASGRSTLPIAAGTETTRSYSGRTGGECSEASVIVHPSSMCGTVVVAEQHAVDALHQSVEGDAATRIERESGTVELRPDLAGM